MYRVLIVDDEPIVCEGLRTFPWEQYGCQIAAEATDGIEGLEKLKECSPHIVITDIKMPGMDGIEFSRKGKEFCPDTEFIVLTGFADFHFAQESLKIGVADYLLKPFRFEDIEAALKPALERIRQHQEENDNIEAMTRQLQNVLPILREQVFQDLLEGNLPMSQRRLQICQIPEQKYIVFSTQSDISTRDFNDLALYGILQEAIGSLHEQFYLAKGVDIISCVLCFKPEKEDGLCEAAAVNFCELIRRSVDETYRFSISVGISRVSSDIFQLHLLREQSVKALNEKYAIGGDLIMLYSDIKETPALSAADYTPLEKVLHKSLISKDPDAIAGSFQDIVKLAVSSSPDTDAARTTLMTILFHAVHFMTSASSNADVAWKDLNQLVQVESMEAFVACCHRILNRLPRREHDSAHQYITDKIMAYIEQNYEKDVSLDTLSRQLNYSNTYLSRLIKKNCGKNFTELLLDCRIRHAKELLKTSELKINQIAAAVGYGDFSYFIQIFKKKAGVTPSDYRTMHNIEKSL